MFRFAISCLTLLVAGCATSALAPKLITEVDLTEANGILIGSFSRDPNGPSYYSQTFRFKNTATSEEHSINSQSAFNIWTGKTPDDFEFSDSHGGVFAFSLPAGEYTFYDFRLFQSNGAYHQNWTSEEPYSIPFSIQANKVNYVGEIKLTPLTGKNFFGLDVHAGGVWVISDQKDRDVEIISKKHPEIPMEEVVTIIPERKEIFTPLVILPSEMGHQDNRVN